MRKKSIGKNMPINSSVRVNISAFSLQSFYRLIQYHQLKLYELSEHCCVRHPCVSSLECWNDGTPRRPPQFKCTQHIEMLNCDSLHISYVSELLLVLLLLLLLPSSTMTTTTTTTWQFDTPTNRGNMIMYKYNRFVMSSVSKG